MSRVCRADGPSLKHSFTTINRPCTKDTHAGDYGGEEKLPNNYLNQDMLAPTSERNGEMKEERRSNRRKERERKERRQGQRGEGMIMGR